MAGTWIEHLAGPATIDNGQRCARCGVRLGSSVPAFERLASVYAISGPSGNTTYWAVRPSDAREIVPCAENTEGVLER